MNVWSFQNLLASFDCNAKVLLYLKSILEKHFTGFEAVLLIALSLFLSQYVFRITSLFLRELSANFTQLFLCSFNNTMYCMQNLSCPCYKNNYRKSPWNCSALVVEFFDVPCYYRRIIRPKSDFDCSTIAESMAFTFRLLRKPIKVIILTAKRCFNLQDQQTFFRNTPTIGKPWRLPL